MDAVNQAQGRRKAGVWSLTGSGGRTAPSSAKVQKVPSGSLSRAGSEDLLCGQR